jgi:hypothetical protein
VIVVDDTVSIPWLINKTLHFFKHESCGKCTPCREGTFWMMHLIERIECRKAHLGRCRAVADVASQMGQMPVRPGRVFDRGVLRGSSALGDFRASKPVSKPASGGAALQQTAE